MIETKRGVRVSQITIMELVSIYVGIKIELVVTIIEVLTQMQGGFDYVIVPCILPMLPIIPIDPLAITAST